jgi:hypothetical protein
MPPIFRSLLRTSRVLRWVGLNTGATFIMDDAAGMTKNFTAADPMGIGIVFQLHRSLG